MARMKHTGAGRLGASLRDVIAEATVKVRTAIAPHEQAARVQANRAHMDVMETELAPRITALLTAMIAGEDIHPAYAELMAAAGGPEHATDFFLQIAIALSAIFGLIFQLGTPIVQGQLNRAWSQNQHLRLTPQQLAEAFVRGVPLPEPMYNEAGETGLDPPRMDVLTRLAGEPPGPLQLVEAFRRGIIDSERLAHGIRQSRVFDEWIDVLTGLRFMPPEPAAAVQAAVQGHLDIPTATAKAEAGGLDPADFGWRYETAGEPPGVHELLEAWNHGLIDEATVTTAVMESRIKNKYIPAIKQLRYHFPPERSIVAMVTHGGLTVAQGTDHLLKLGFFPEDVAALMTEATRGKLGAHHTASQSQIVEAYETGMIDNAGAAAHLQAIGFEASEAAFVLSVADHRKELQVHNAAVTKVLGWYVAHRIDAQAAGAALDGIGMVAGERDRLIHLATLERQAVTRPLTLAQLVKAWKNSTISDADFSARLINMGYSPADAAIITAIS